MALKTLDEVITKILTTPGPHKDLPKFIRGELRDFVAHEVMRYEALNLNSEKVLGAQELFDRIFGGSK